MARTEINVGVPGLNGSAELTATALTNGATGTSGYVVQDSQKDQCLTLIAYNSGSATGALWVKASDSMEGAGIGDATYYVGIGKYVAIGPFDGFRFRQMSTGYINVDSGITGSIYAVENRMR